MTSYDKRLNRFLTGRWYISLRRGGQLRRHLGGRSWIVCRPFRSDPGYYAYVTPNLRQGGTWRLLGTYPTQADAKQALAEAYAVNKAVPCP
jgi:hypothetical protein